MLDTPGHFSNLKHKANRISRSNLDPKMLEGNQDTPALVLPDTLNAQGGQQVEKNESLNAEMDPLDRRNSHDGVTFNSHEQLQLNELREARIRAVQMEKTMRWWSDCTANWRDKWGQVKNERNKAREDIKILKQKLDDANQSIYELKRERNEFKEGNTQLRANVEKMSAELKRDRRAFVPPMRITENSNAHVSNMVKAQLDTTELSYDESALQDSKMQALIITDADAFVEITKAHDKRFEAEQSFNSAHEQNATINGGDKRTKDDNGSLDEMKTEMESLKEKLQNAENKITEETR
jgi:uncharacterized coiled-coil DUF342 family protein